MKYMYWLDTIEGIGDKTKEKLFARIGKPREIYEASEEALEGVLEKSQLRNLLNAKESRDLDREYHKLLAKGIQITTLDCKDYPLKLAMIPDPPYCLYYKGKLPREDRISVALIGARECSEYGRYLATEIGKELALSGIQIISGMARGIDGIGQMSALEYGGTSFGVLGCGVDICYPKSNERLYQELLNKGGILSSFPPGTFPKRSLFPPRNRIVSGLCDALLVIEARQKSGTLITVDMALEQGKDVFAVPGRVTDRLSDGCNKLIKDGAGVFLTPGHFVEELKDMFATKSRTILQNEGKNENIQTLEEENLGDLETLDKCILKELDFYPKPLEEITASLREKHGFTGENGAISNRLMWLCIRGIVIQNSSNWFSRAIANEGKTW